MICKRLQNAIKYYHGPKKFLVLVRECALPIKALCRVILFGPGLPHGQGVKRASKKRRENEQSGTRTETGSRGDISPTFASTYHITPLTHRHLLFPTSLIDL